MEGKSISARKIKDKIVNFIISTNRSFFNLDERITFICIFTAGALTGLTRRLSTVIIIMAIVYAWRLIGKSFTDKDEKQDIAI